MKETEKGTAGFKEDFNLDGSSKKRGVIQEMLKQSSDDIVILYETKRVIRCWTVRGLEVDRNDVASIKRV